MDDQVELLSNQLRERGGSQERVAELVLEQEFHDRVGEFVGTSGARALRDQAGQASAVKGSPARNRPPACALT